MIKDYYFKCLLIRKTEQLIEKLFSEGKLFGTTHCCIGQEYIPVSILPKLKESDHVTSTHRSHGHFLALFQKPELLLGELMGKSIGVNKGLCGSQHLQYKNFYTNGITGGMIPVATGLAMAEKLNKSNNIVVAFLGDGAMNEGYVLESLNFASVNSLPILYVLENNHFAMSTRSENVTAGSIIGRIQALNMNIYTIGIEEEIEDINYISSNAINFARQRKPTIIIFDTFRFCGHSKSDKCEYIDETEKQKYIKNDYLAKLENELSICEIHEIQYEVDGILEYALKICEQSELTRLWEVYNEIWS
jgi:TPP-dependent pyruvate/acetoin dehydrogenase alpha subunit